MGDAFTQAQLGSLRSAIESGIGYIDTAAAYDGVEALLGEVADFLRLRCVRLCTKLTVYELDHDLAASLTRLKCDRVDTLLLHNARRSDLVDNRVADWMVQTKRQGHASLTGASTYGAEDAQLALEQLWCDVVQVEHSILNPSVVRILAALKRTGQEIVVRSVLCKGLLTARRHHATHLGTALAVTLDRLETRASEWGFSLPELAIRFALDTPGVNIVLVGMSSLTELETALAAARYAPLEPWQMESLAEFDCSFEDWSHPERWGLLE
jgi:aryl-alcohol dehydrogenase-like predicted oxidoreductase